jgi:lysophospholipase L1-like esterase
MENKWKTINWKEVFDRGVLNPGNVYRMSLAMKRAETGEPITVAFIGGSITAGAAATTAETCYAYLVYTWWMKRFPNCEVTYLNAGVGATTSKFGVARVEEEILNLKPDVVFAEFSVNDTDNELFFETFEGLVRRILLDDSQAALFMFNNVFYDDGHNAQCVHNQVGNYYDLPIVSIRESIYAEITKGSISNLDISADNLHPNDLGHELIAGVITNLLDRIYEQVVTNQTKLEEYQVPVKPLTRNRYYGSKRYSNRNTEPKLTGFAKDTTTKEGVWDVFRYGWSGRKAGSSLLFEVEGSIISAQYRKYAKHPAPIAKLIIDGDQEKATILDANFEETWGDCLYLQDIATNLAPGKHFIEVIITEEVHNKDFYLASIICS